MKYCKSRKNIARMRANPCAGHIELQIRILQFKRRNIASPDIILPGRERTHVQVIKSHQISIWQSFTPSRIAHSSQIKHCRLKYCNSRDEILKVQIKYCRGSTPAKQPVCGDGSALNLNNFGAANIYHKYLDDKYLNGVCKYLSQI